ncbi:MAG: hypothetical protein AB8I58_11245 [Anaerolineales bacterium]|jgi:hypothetical protein
MKSVPICKVGLALVGILGIFLAACGPTPAFASGNLQPCTPTTPEANVYRVQTHPQVTSIYSRWVQNQSNSDPVVLQSLKNEAFTLLVDRVKHWTSSVDIPVDNTNVIRISLTYISPELTQFIILNHQLYNNVLSEPDFENMLRTRMNVVAEREELIFLMTITYSQYNNQIATENNRITLNIPMDGLALTNAENLHIAAYHIDPPLRQEIVVSHGPSTGYVAFPIGVGTSENCTHVMDRSHNTVLNVSVSGIKVNGNDYASQLSWSAKYHPLIEMNNGIITPAFSSTAPIGIPINQQPLIPALTIPVEQVDSGYWAQMALHVWGHVTNP